MAMNRIQFQATCTLPQFIELYEPSQKCEVFALEQARWPDVSVAHVVRQGVRASSLAGSTQRYSVRSCPSSSHPPAPVTILEANKVPSDHLVPCLYLVGQAKTGISSLVLRRPRGVNYRKRHGCFIQDHAGQ